MDPLAHTLVGASLSETRLKQLSTLATPTLVLAANAPDIDILSVAGGGDFSLGFRRGWTHGVLAMVLLPLALAGLMLVAERAFARFQGRQPCARFGPLVVLSAIGVWSHPLLDWLNTYGIRLLMPFDERWFYGDALFIIDPWLWLLAGTAVVLATTQTWSRRNAWLVLGVMLTALVTGVAPVPTMARVAWIAGLAALVGVRTWQGFQTRVPAVAMVCLGVAALYIAMMLAGSRLAARQVEAWLADRGDDGRVVMAGPLPANPFVRDIVVADDSHYHFLQLNWLRPEPIQVTGPPIERGLGGPIVEAAVAAPHVRGVMTWIRFPAFSVESRTDGHRVTIRDVRYTRLDGVGIGTAIVELDRDLQVVEPAGSTFR